MALKLGELEVEIGADTSGLKKAEKEVKGTTKSMERSFSSLGKTIAAAVTIESARRAVMIADNMRRLEGVVKRLTKTTGDFNQVWAELNKVSDANGVAINDSIALFQRFQMSLKNVTDQNGEVIDFIDTLQKIGRIGGSSSQEMSNALTQLSQGLSGGIIRAEEWNSIIEQAPEILNVAAKNIQGVNGDLGVLRKQMLDGKLTAELFYEAISKGADDVNKEFSELPKTIDQSLTRLENSFARFVGDIDKKIGASENIAKFIEGLAIAAEDATAEIDALLGPTTEQGKIIRMQELNDEIAEQARLVEKLKTEGVGLLDALFGDTDIKSEERQLRELREEYKKLQDQIGIPGISKPSVISGAAETKAKPAGIKTPPIAISVDDEIKRLDLLADVYDDKFAEIEADILRKREKAIRLYGEKSKEFLAIDEQLNQNRINLYLEAEEEIGSKASDTRDKITDANDKLAEQTAAAFEAMSDRIGNELGDAITKTQSFSDAFKNILADLATQLISAGITSAFGGAVGGGNIFSGMFATAGGNAFGGGVSPIAAHRVNERGAPEMLNQAGKQYLLPNGRGGTVTPLSGADGQSQPNVSIINMGTPMNIESTNITEDGVELMINDKLAAFDKSLTAEMSKPNSPKSRALKNTFRLEQNMRR